MEHENHLEPLKDLFPLDDINREASSFNGLTRKWLQTSNPYVGCQKRYLLNWVVELDPSI